MSSRLGVVCLTALLLVAAPGIFAQSPSAPELFTVISDGDASGLMQPRAAVRFARQVRIDTSLLLRTSTPGARLTLGLGPDATAVVELDSITDDEFNGVVWSGRIVGDPLGSASLVYSDGIVVGAIVYQGRGFDLRPRRGGSGDRGVVVEYDPAVVPAGNDVLTIPEGLVPAGASADPVSPASGKDVTVDILGLYMKEAANEVGGTKDEGRLEADRCGHERGAQSVEGADDGPPSEGQEDCLQGTVGR
jgi:hypothetical protein